LFRSMIGAHVEADFAREHIGGSRRQRAEDNLRSGQPVRGLVDGAITTGCQNDIEIATGRKLSGHRTRSFRSGCGEKLDGAASLPKHLSSSIQTSALTPLQTARERIENDGNSM